MEIVVRGRHLNRDVGESFRQHCETKLERLGRLDHRLRRLDVELSHEPNPRQSGQCQRVEITVHTRGPVVRAEAAAGECYAAFEGAFAKLEERMRRAADRRTASHSHSHHQHLPAADAAPLSEAGANLALADLAGLTVGGEVGAEVAPTAASASDAPNAAAAEERLHAGGLHEIDGGLIVREKTYEPEAMSLDEAVHRMELVGHDFYLFCDEATGAPSVVYKRRGYDYGVLRLVAPTPVIAQQRDGSDTAPVSSDGAHPALVSAAV